MKKTVFTLLFLANVLNVFAQTQIQGTVLDKATHQPIPFVNIGFMNKNIGTITDKNGSFNLSIPPELLVDSVCFSHVSYGLLKKSINEVLKDTLIELEQANYSFPTLTITPKATVTLGRKTDKGIKIVVKTKNKQSLSGAEMGTLIKNNNPLLIKEAAFLLGNNVYERMTIRVRIYDAQDRNNFILLNKTDKLMTIKNKAEGWFIASFDGLKDRIIVENNFFVSIEIVDVAPAEGQLILKGAYSPMSKNAFSRKASLGEWHNSPLNLNFYVSAEGI